MRVISLITGKKALILSALVQALCIAGLLAFFGLVGVNSDDFIMVAPGSRSLDRERLDEILGDGILLTYELTEETRVNHMNAGHSAIAVYTNFAHPHVLGYRILNGGFFTAAHQEFGVRAVTLNKSAAFNIFGSLNTAGQHISIDNREYLVTGVIDDDDSENNRVYLPASLSQRPLSTVITPVDESANLSHEYVLNRLSSAGISEGGNVVWNLTRVSGIFWVKALIAFGVSIASILALCGITSKRKLIRGVRMLKKAYKDDYASQLLSKERLRLFKIALQALALAVAAVGIAAIALYIVNLCMQWSAWSINIEVFSDYFISRDSVVRYNLITTATLIFHGLVAAMTVICYMRPFRTIPT